MPVGAFEINTSYHEAHIFEEIESEKRKSRTSHFYEETVGQDVVAEYYQNDGPIFHDK